MDDEAKLILQLREKIDSSRAAIVLMSRHYGDNIKSLAELGMILLSGKPMLILYQKAHHPLNIQLRTTAEDYEMYDDADSLMAAATKLLNRNAMLFEGTHAEPLIIEPNEPSKN